MTQEDAIKWLSNLKNDIGNPHYERLWPYAQALDEICELLKEQEPVMPKEERLNDVDSIYRCGNCGTHFYYRQQKYCAICGRKAKWG